LRYQHATDMRADLARLKRDTDSSRVSAAAVMPTSSSGEVREASGRYAALQQASASTPLTAVAAMTPASGSSVATPTISTPGTSTQSTVTGGAVTGGSSSTSPMATSGTRWPLVVGAVILVAALAVGGYFFTHRAPALTGKGSIVLADFTNTTGDAVFDDALRQGLAAQMAQSPFLNILSDQQVRQQLSFMGQAPTARLTNDLARQVCQRTQSAAVLDGSIAQIGNTYNLVLNALNCGTGETLATATTQATDKNQVLGALGKVAEEMRGKLGESLASIQKYNTPIEAATTSSLEALKAYSLGIQARASKGEDAAAPFLKQAVTLDPNFAMATAVLGQVETNLGAVSIGTEYTKKAYALRDRASELEKFYIESHYHENVTGDSQQAAQVYQLWAQTYPHDSIPRGNLSVSDVFLGQWEKALPEALEGHRLSPDESLNYFQIASVYVGLGRLDEAKATIDDALAKKLNVALFHVLLYRVAFLQGDSAAMERELSAVSKSSPEMAALALNVGASTEAYFGRLEKARALVQRAVTSQEGVGVKDRAATAMIALARTEAQVGDAAAARKDAAAGLALAPSFLTKGAAAYVFALAGDTSRAESLAGEIAKERPSDTIANVYLLPTIRAAVELNRNNPGKAIEILQPVIPYDLAEFRGLSSAYERGQAYLVLHQGHEAAAEFQKILDHPGVVFNSVTGPLAHLQMGRAYTLTGDGAKARAAYQDFFALWKDADPDIPILKQAKAEYSKLQ